jgi:hypothetical protein
MSFVSLQLLFNAQNEYFIEHSGLTRKEGGDITSFPRIAKSFRIVQLPTGFDFKREQHLCELENGTLTIFFPIVPKSKNDDFEINFGL